MADVEAMVASGLLEVVTDWSTFPDHYVWSISQPRR
jgi:hypothetical protein